MSAPNKRPRGRPAIPKDVQRRRIVEAAFRAFERSPYERTTVADIVGEAGMSSRSFYAHFASKDDLAAQIVEEYGAELLGQVAEILSETPDDVPAHVDRALGAWLEILPAAAIDLERLGGDAGRRVGEMRRRIVQELVDLTLAYMVRLHGLGLVPRPPVRAEVELLLTGIEGMSLRYYSEGRRDELLALRPVLRRLLLVGLG
ncbi:MAG TPA: TetR/AcrR family transcriptional regulator [Vicinamibacteria bacterium]|nr:TetR/AcrR family transcriptional regulator [Vicinamibacteria bacterium]